MSNGESKDRGKGSRILRQELTAEVLSLPETTLTDELQVSQWNSHRIRIRSLCEPPSGPSSSCNRSPRSTGSTTREHPGWSKLNRRVVINRYNWFDEVKVSGVKNVYTHSLQPNPLSK